MKLTISYLLLWLLISTSVLSADLRETLLRQAANDNGYRPPSEINLKFNLDQSIIGKKLFESELLSFNSNTSCQSCHLDEFSSADGLPNAVGVGGEGRGLSRLTSGGSVVPRNTLPLWGRGSLGFETFFWDGKVEKIDGVVNSQFGLVSPSEDPLVTAVHLPFVEIREMVMDNKEISTKYKTESISSAKLILNSLVEKLKTIKLGVELSSSLDKNIDELEFIDIVTAITGHIKNNFAIGESKFSQFYEGKGQLSKNEIDGGLIFYGKGRCSSCHSGPHFSDFKFHNIIFPQLGFGKNGFGIDYGRFNVTKNYKDLYKFRTPPLANVSKTRPYGHSGSLKTLVSVIVSHFDPLRYFNTKDLDPIRRRELFVRIQSTAGQPNPTYLDNMEIKDLIAFLNTLSF